MRPILLFLPSFAMVAISAVFAAWCLWAAWRQLAAAGKSDGKSDGKDRAEPDRAGAIQVGAFGIGQLILCLVVIKAGWLTEIPIHSYGTCLMLGFGSAIALSAFLASRNGLDPNVVIDLGLIAIASSIFGSRVFYYILEYDAEFADKPFFHFFYIWKGGMSVVGGVIAASIFCSIYLVKTKVGWMPYADACAPSIPLGQGFGRLGCYLNGCCWGRPCGEDSSVASLFGGACHFPKIVSDGEVTGSFAFNQHVELGLIDPGADQAAAVHPTQLYSSLASFTLCALLLLAFRYRLWQGMIFTLYAVLYPVQRFTVEFFRGDRLIWRGGEAPTGTASDHLSDLVRHDANFLGFELSVFQAAMIVVWPVTWVLFVVMWRRGTPLGRPADEAQAETASDVPGDEKK